jgi:hypothetical protein
MAMHAVLRVVTVELISILLVGNYFRRIPLNSFGPAISLRFPVAHSSPVRGLVGKPIDLTGG